MNNNLKVMLVDDDFGFLNALSGWLCQKFPELEGSITTANRVIEAKRLMAENNYDLIIADIDFTDVGEASDAGLDVLEFVKSASPDSVVILMTGKADPSTVFEGAKKGAWDFFHKSSSLEGEVLPRLYMAIALIKERRKSKKLSREVIERESRIAFYRRAIWTSWQLILAVSLAIAATLLTSGILLESKWIFAVFFGVLLFCTVIFELIKRFILKVGPLQVSADSGDQDGR